VSDEARADHNPFASPTDSVGGQGVAVFSPVAVAVHSFLFTPFFGGAVAAMNWVAVGYPKRGARTLGLGTLALGLAVAIGVAMPPAYVGIALLFSTVLYFEQQMLRRHWPELPIVGIALNVAIAGCFFLALSSASIVVLAFWILI